MCAAVNSLKASADFQRISRQGRKWVLPAFTMLALAREKSDDPFRYGLTVSRKVGNAVVRNRAKRRLREVVRKTAPAGLAGFDVVLIARTAAAERDFALLCQDFATGLAKLGVAS